MVAGTSAAICSTTVMEVLTGGSSCLAGSVVCACKIVDTKHASAIPPRFGHTGSMYTDCNLETPVFIGNGWFETLRRSNAGQVPEDSIDTAGVRNAIIAALRDEAQENILKR